MRIMLVSWEYPPVIEGGLGRHVAGLSTALARAGHEVHVLTRSHPRNGLPADPFELPSESELGDVRVHRVDIPPFTHEMDAFMVWVQQLNARLRRRGREVLEATDGFDLVHSHDWMVAGAAEALAAAAGTPWLVTVHATEFGRHNGWVHTHPQRAIHLTERHMVRTADHVICCSRYMADHVRRVFGVAPERLSAIPNGINPAVLAPEAGTDLATLRDRYANPSERLVLMVGRLVYEKGFHVALDALAPLITADPRVRFVVAGTGTAEADLHAQAARLGLTDHGTFLGRVDDEMLHGLYRVADVTVVPSLYEPFGIVPLEAMISGCPVVVASTGGLREVVAGSDAAVKFSPGDAGELSRVLAEVLADSRRREAMRRAGGRHAATFAWTAVAGRTETVYADVIAATQPLAV